jgi:hypothetical protein
VNLYLVTTTATSVTGFFFHRDHVLPSHIVGAVALVVLAFTYLALYGFRLRGIWRAAYTVGAVPSLWLNVFVLIAHAFLTVPSLHVLAPRGSETPFAVSACRALLIELAASLFDLFEMFCRPDPYAAKGCAKTHLELRQFVLGVNNHFHGIAFDHR